MLVAGSALGSEVRLGRFETLGVGVILQLAVCLQVLLRGCMLRNTPHVFGVVIFSGHQTKVQRFPPAGFRNQPPDIPSPKR